MRLAFILNPRSGNGRALRDWQRLEGKVRTAVGPFDLYFTDRPGHASELVKRAIDAGCTRIVSCGGDGTHFEVVNGLFEHDRPLKPDIEMAVFPLGTGSDLPRTLRIPRNPERAIPFLMSDSVVASDLGKLTCINEATNSNQSCYFITSCHMGMGGAINEYVNTHSKALGGRLSFFIALLAISRTFKPTLMQIDCDGRQFEEVLVEFTVANGQYDGGGMNVAPHARLNSGEFEIYTMPDLGPIGSLVNMPRLYLGTQDKNPKVKRFQGKRIQVGADSRILATPDGELAGCLPATLEIVPEIMRFVTGPNPPVL